MAMSMEELMRGALEQRASDIHLKTGNPPIFRIDGSLRRLDDDMLTEDRMRELHKQIASPTDIAKFEKVMESDISYMFEGIARFRVNVCKDDGDTRIVMRLKRV